MAAQAWRLPALWKLLEMGSAIDPSTEIFQMLSHGRGQGKAARAKFLEEVRLDPPRFLRVIDCQLSVQEQAVVIIDFPIQDVQYGAGSSGSAIGFTAISHTYGQPVYDAFNCSCAADCRAHVPRADPAKSPCNHDDVPGLQKSVIGDVLGMCRLLVSAGGVRYAWHDGVCIAQHDGKEVEHFIQHIAWIYANADDTVIFLHYIGRPMAPIAPSSTYPDAGPTSRWQTRVWTFQEAALSKRRRYCVRRGVSLGNGRSDFKQKLASWYEPNGANSTEILDEPEFWKLVWEIFESFPGRDHVKDNIHNVTELVEWSGALITWMHLLWSLHCSFPTIAHALESSSSRESKHEGDRINSILGLARVKGFSAHKDDKVEESTMEFFKRMEKAGLAIALFTTNQFEAIINARPHTWYPTLCSPLHFTPSHFGPSGPNFHTDRLQFEVRSEDGSLEVRGQLACVSLHVTLVPRAEEIRDRVYNVGARSGQSLAAFAGVDDYITATLAAAGWQMWLPKKNLICTDRVLLGSALPARNEILANLVMEAQLIRGGPPNLESLVSRLNIQEDVDDAGDELLQEKKFIQDAIQKFSAFNLIFPAELLDEYEYNREEAFEDLQEHCDLFDTEKYLWSSRLSFAAIMIRGDVSSSNQSGGVEKVGCFVGSPMLGEILQEYSQYVTFLDKLVII